MKKLFEKSPKYWMILKRLPRALWLLYSCYRLNRKCGLSRKLSREIAFRFFKLRLVSS
jgi:hypothetical protein